MNHSRIVRLGIALLCIASIGVVGTALDSSVTTDPDEEIDLNYDQLPIETSDAAVIQEEIESGERDETTADQLFQGAKSVGMQVTQPTLLDRLLALLGAIVRVLLPLGAMIALAALVYHYRDRLLAILGRTVTTDDGESESATAADTWPGSEPSTPVDLAWLSMVIRADPDRPATKTPGECATIAREAGIDSTVVDTITDAFERVHYGGAPVEREADRARAALEQLRGDGRKPPDCDRKRRGGEAD